MEAPEGFFGGLNGKPGAIVKNPGESDEVTWPSKTSGASVQAGDVLRIVTPSGGGYYDPLERDPEAVLSDVMDDYFALNSVKELFGVVIDESSMKVDEKATVELRKSMKKKNS
jgi:N-methylhydantoinase B/oxoprolinase/acetone carboxylase alpha subunit